MLSMKSFKSLISQTSQYLKFTNINAKFFSDKFKEKETAEESIYVSKSDREALKNLLKKVKKTDKVQIQSESNDLKTILKKHNVNVTDKLVSDIMEWKDIHH